MRPNTILKFILAGFIAIMGSSCVKKNYTTQSKANTYNDYKAAKYNMKNKKKKRR